MNKPVQTRENHLRLDPMFHFFLVPISFFLFIWSLVHIYHHRTSESVLIACGLLILLLSIVKTRAYSLKVQDRVIRLEERLRLDALCGDAFRGTIPELTEAQLIALRFASDAEVPSLAAKALIEKLNPKQIKAAVQKWRGDYFRV